MNVAAEVVAGLTSTTPDYAVSRRSNTDTASSSPSSSSAAAAVTSAQHVDFRVETDDVNVNEKQTKGRFLTAKYPKHQMGLIRRRLVVEDWIDEQLKILFDISDEDYETYDTVLELDEVLNLDTDAERTAYIQERISIAPKPEDVRNKFVAELLEKASSL